ncbi:MAG: hypothetical protein GNW80_03260 [Asgard group archaeon]|nr:hypothetical protein [Asgard group archaeon]
MKLSSILKNRKAMTPIMIGIIVAASVLAVFFIVMAATIPFYGQDLNMTIKANSIRGNTTDNIQLSFRMICDYDVGILKEVTILRDSIVYGDNTPMAFRNGSAYWITLQKSQELTVTINFTASSLFPPLPPEGETAEGLFIFGHFLEYTLRIYYEDQTGGVQAEKSFEFIFDD